jgi:tetratricopeptide (TPR) repeat protein
MRKSVTTLMAVAFTLSAWTVANASTVVIGGLAGHCSDLAKMGRSDPDSIGICTQALAGEPLDRHDRAGTFVNRGAMEIHNQDYAAAHRDFQEALMILPTMGEALIGEGAYLVSQQRFAEADAAITRGLALNPEEPEKGYYFRALARWGQDDFKGAYFDFKRASELKPNWELPRREMANFHVQPAG